MTRYISLGEYFWLAEQVTGIEAIVLTKASRSDLADSALNAPAASFAGEEFYPDLADKAAVLVCRLAWNQLLPDGKSVDLRTLWWLDRSRPNSLSLQQRRPNPRRPVRDRRLRLALLTGSVTKCAAVRVAQWDTRVGEKLGGVARGIRATWKLAGPTSASGERALTNRPKRGGSLSHDLEPL